MSAGVIGVLVGLVIGGVEGFAIGARCGMGAMQRILIDAFDKHLDDEDTLSVAAIKKIIRAEEDEDDE